MIERDRCRALLTEDLGAPVTALSQLSAHEKSLFAVFGARLLSDGKDLKQAQELLDSLNRSCHQPTRQGKKGYPDLSLAEVAFAKYARHPAAERERDV